MIAVLRLGHRVDRDKRITTHVALVARAFGAEKIFITTKDVKIEKTLASICSRFGSDFRVESGVSPSSILNHWEGSVVHLTMYGTQLSTALSQLNTHDNTLVIVGAEKVPRYIYERADFNIAVGNQPHSEVAALALFLDRFTQGQWENHSFHGQVEIIPTERGKQVITHDTEC